MNRHALRFSRLAAIYSAAAVMSIGLLTLAAPLRANAQETAATKKDDSSTPPRQNVDHSIAHPVATIETDLGKIRIELYPEDAPKTVENFIRLAKLGFYDGVAFHRVVPGFVAQGGDPLTKTLPAGDPRLGTGGPGYTIPDEKNKVLKHLVGAVAMAKTSAPDSAGSQFYIVITNPQPRLDAMGYTVFGQVIEGQKVAEKLTVGDRMKKVTVVEPPKPKNARPDAEKSDDKGDEKKESAQ